MSEGCLKDVKTISGRCRGSIYFAHSEVNFEHLFHCLASNFFAKLHRELVNLTELQSNRVEIDFTAHG